MIVVGVGFIALVVGVTLLLVMLASVKKEEWERLERRLKKMIIGAIMMVPFFIKIPYFEKFPVYRFAITGSFISGFLIFLWGISGFVVGKEEEKRLSIITFLTITGVIIIIVFTAAQIISLYNIEVGLMLVEILPIIVAMFVLIAPFLLLTELEKPKVVKRKKGREERESGGEEEKKKLSYKNPFRELLKEISKVLLILISLTVLLPQALSVGYLILYVDPGFEDVKVITDVKYNVTTTPSSIEVTLYFPKNISSTKVTVIISYPDKVIKRSYTIIDNAEPRIDDLRSKGKSVRQLFSVLGLYNFWIPMFLVFLLVYALSKVILPKDTGKDIRALIAFSIAILFGYSSWATSFVTNYIPYLAAGIVIIFGAGIILVTIMPEGVKNIRENPYLYNFLIWLALSIILFALGYSIDVLSNGGVTSILSKEIYPNLPLGSILILFWIAILIVMEIFPLIRQLFRI